MRNALCGCSGCSCERYYGDGCCDSGCCDCGPACDCHTGSYNSASRHTRVAERQRQLNEALRFAEEETTYR